MVAIKIYMMTASRHERGAYRGLHQAPTLLAHLFQIAKHVEDAVLFRKLNVGVNGQVDARSAGAIVAMHYHRSVLRVGVMVHDVPHPPAELEQGVGERV